MEQKKLEIGLKFSKTAVVTEDLTVPRLPAGFGGFGDMPPVFATPYLVAFVEWTCLVSLQEYLEPGQRTVGTAVCLSHTGATPVGMKITSEVELVSLEGKLMQFKVVVRDEAQVVSEGTHDRAIINYEKFMSKFK